MSGERRKKIILLVSGVVLAVFALLCLLATVSYPFHWKEDMSVLERGGEVVGNICGRAGAIIGNFLFAETFGFGAFALIALLFEASWQMIFTSWDKKAFKRISATILAIFIISLTGGIISFFSGTTNFFGKGFGGDLGHKVTIWLNNLVGPVITTVIALLLIAGWIFICSFRFRRKVDDLTSRSEGFEDDGEEECIEEYETVEEVQQEEEEEEEEEEEAPAVEKPAASVGRPARSVESPDGDKGFTIVEDTGLSTEIQKPLPPINNRLDPPYGLPKFKAPGLDLLKTHSDKRYEVPKDELTSNKDKIKITLANYKIQIVKVEAIVGSTVTLYKVFPAPGVQIAQIRRLQEDIGISLNARGVRVSTLADSVGIEVANEKPSIVPVRALLNDANFRGSKADLPVAIGYTIQQQVKVFDLADAPHLLVAGATKQGKSVGLNIIINSLLYSKHPSELKFVFIDPKMVEFTAYSKLLHHYLAVMPANSEEEEKKNAIVKKAKDAEVILKSLCIEMDERYNLFTTAGDGVNNIKVYNDKFKNRKLNPEHGHRFLPYLVVIVDEYADLTMTLGASMEVKNSSRSITNSIIRLAQKGRAAGIHVILATQRPSVDVINGVIKSNFPLRIAFRVASRTDSQTIIDSPGAERLIGNGDMLLSASIDSERIQCGFITGDEIRSVTDFISEQRGYARSYNTPYYLPIPTDSGEDGEGGGPGGEIGNIDERFEEAARMVVMSQRGSTSDLQRKLGMGYARAGKVMDQLEAAGVVGPQEGSKPRQVLISDFDSLQEILDRYL